MPVVIDYSPVAAAGGLAQRVGNNDAYLKTQQLGREQEQIDMQRQAQAAAQQEQQARMAMEEQQMALHNQPQSPGGSTAPSMPSGVTRYQDGQGATYMVTPEQRQQLYNLQSSGIKDPEAFSASERQILGTPDLVKTTLPDGTVTYMPKNLAATNLYRGARMEQQGDQFSQRMQQQGDQFTQKMQASDQARQQNLQAAGQRVQAMIDIATQRNISAGDKERIQLSLQAHQSMVTQAKTHLETAQQQLGQIMTNTPFDDAAVKAAKAAVQKASDDYDQAAQDLRSDVEGHIAKLQAGVPLNKEAPPPGATSPAGTPPPAVAAAKGMGAVNVPDEPTAKAYMQAAGSGKVATQADVNAAMGEAKGDVAAAKAKLKAEGFLFTKSGIQL